MDDKTIRKDMRKLSGGGFVKSESLMFRPTLRIKGKIDKERFYDVMQDYMMFVQGKGGFEDILESLNGASGYDSKEDSSNIEHALKDLESAKPLKSMPDQSFIKTTASQQKKQE